MEKTNNANTAETKNTNLPINNGPEIASKFLVPGSMYQERYSTGFKTLDDVLHGGFSKGLNLIGAVPGIGKSALCINLAYEMCKVGTRVIYLSLEMDADAEVMTRMISLQSSELYGLTADAFTVEELTRFTEKQFIKWEKEKQSRYYATVEAVTSATKTLTVWENQDGTYTSERLEKDLEQYFATSNDSENVPILIVDYVQILDSANTHKYGTDKMRVEATLRNLKSLSVKYNMPIIVISALSRESYRKGVEISSFKETGLMEYIASTIIGLDLEGIEDKNFNFKKAMKANPRKINLSVLKTRSIPQGDDIGFDFHLSYNRIIERGYRQEAKENKAVKNEKYSHNDLLGCTVDSKMFS